MDGCCSNSAPLVPVYNTHGMACVLHRVVQSETPHAGYNRPLNHRIIFQINSARFAASACSAVGQSSISHRLFILFFLLLSSFHTNRQLQINHNRHVEPLASSVWPAGCHDSCIDDACFFSSPRSDRMATVVMTLLLPRHLRISRPGSRA